MIILLLFTTITADIIIKPPNATFPTRDTFTPTQVPVPNKVDGLLIHDQSQTYYGFNWLMCSPFLQPQQRFKNCQLEADIVSVAEPYTTDVPNPNRFSFYGAQFHDQLNWNFTRPFLRPNFTEYILNEGESNRIFPFSSARNRSMTKFYTAFYQLLSYYEEGEYIAVQKKAINWGNTITYPLNRTYPEGTKLASFCYTIPIYKEATIKLSLLVDGKQLRTIYVANTTNFICESYVFNGTVVTVKLQKNKFITQYGVSSGFYLFRNTLKVPRTIHIVPQCDHMTWQICESQIKACNKTPNCLVHNLGPFPLQVPDPVIIDSFWKYLIQAFKDSIYCVYKKVQFENLNCNFFSQYYTPYLSPSNYSIWVREENGEAKPLQAFNKILDLSRHWDYFTIDTHTFNFYEPLIQNLLDTGFNWIGGYLVKPTIQTSDTSTPVETLPLNLSMSPGVAIAMCCLAAFLIFILIFSCCLSVKLQKQRRS